MKNFLNHTITLNILFCVSYFFLATLGFEWGALTINATLLWPPSGLAVFGCMILGRKILPGLLIGAIVSSKIISLENPFSNTFISLMVATITGFAAIAQAYLIAYLSRHYYEREFRVTTSSTVVFIFIVMASCIVSTSVGNIALWQAGVITLAAGLQNLVVWWMGDVIGILIITPILFLVYHKYKTYKNSQANAFLIFCTGVGTVLLTVAAIGHNDHDAEQKNRVYQTESLQFSIQTNVDLVTRDLNALQEYFLTNKPTADELKKLGEPFLKRNLWINSFSWIPASDASPKTQSTKLELDFPAGLRLAQATGSEFDWRTIDAQDFPESILTALKTSLVTQQSAISLRNTGERENQARAPMQDLISPISDCTADVKSHCKILGLISTELNLNTLIGAAVARNNISNLDILLSFTDSTGEKSVWRWEHNQLHAIAAQGNFSKAATTIAGKIPVIKVNANEWQLLIYPENISSWFVPGMSQLKVLVVGLTLMILLSAYLQALYRHDQIIIENQARLEEEISNQTRALRLANESLTAEIENKQITQEQLKASEAHMRTLLDNIPDPVWFKSPDGAYLSFNKIVSDLFNRSKNEIVGKRADDYVDNDLATLLENFEKAVLASETSIRQEIWMHVPMLNQQRLMDIIKVAVRDENKQPIGILSIARDITEQHKLINELEKFKRFAEYASEGFSIMTLAAKTLYMNRSMQKMLSSEQVPTHNDFYNYIPTDLHTHWQNKILPHLLLNGYWQSELAALRSDGSRFPTKETFFIIRDDKGQPIYLGEVMIDISEQKNAEKTLQLAKETAEEATRAKSRFLANMSHEIRTPLNAVLGYSQLLMTDTHLSPQQHERLNAILMAGQRLLHLINDILDLSKIEAGALHVREDYFDLRQELNDIAALMRTKAVAKGLALNYKVQLPTPAVIKSDRQKIGQIILNLLGNAIKFTHSGEINLHVSHNEKSILFEIVDTGPGINAHELHLLFAAFKQGKSGEESGGTGLGLVISKHIAEKLGGELTLDSAPGKGTHARLHLPLTIDSSRLLINTTPVIHAKLAENSQCKVLVVEDDQASRDVLVNLLRDTGCNVVEAHNGVEGLAKALSLLPDIIFTDVRMPELSGSDMLKALREKIEKDKMPVIAVSASSLEHERTFYLSEGFHDFISKPYQFSDIYSALQKFTQIEFAQPPQEPTETSTDDEKASWRSTADLEMLLIHLHELKMNFNKGDMNSSKKLFAQHTASTLGKVAHSKIQTAMRQYDLVSAESYLDDVLLEIKTVLDSLKN